MAENALWIELRSSKLGYKFTRQCPIDRWFADFCCRSRKLIVELDGVAHLGQEERDAMRDQALEELGYKVLRFKNEEVLDRMSKTLAVIKEACESRPEFRF